MKTILFTLLASLPLTLFYSNCSRVNLMKDQTVVMASTKVLGQGNLPAPLNPEAPYRVVFFVDQSHSMKYGGCATDLDGQLPAVKEDGSSYHCDDEAPGSDPDRRRYKMINRWLNDLATTKSISAGGIKVAVIPFSGGALHQNPLLQYKFVSIDEAKTLVQELDQQQQDEPMSELGTKKMGTTVPAPYAGEPNENIFSMVKAEMEQLKKAGQLDGSSFEIITITDGVFKPVAELIKKAQDLANCSEAVHSDEFMYCNMTLPNNFELAYGKVANNDPLKIAEMLKAISDLTTTFKGSLVSHRLVRLDYQKTPSFNNKNTNLLPLVSQNLKKLGISSPEIVVSNDEPPFLLQARLEAQLTYYIQNFYVISMNSFVDEFGQLVADSDGDGVSDAEEASRGWDPLNPRSAVAGNGGRCLDGIFKNYGCEKLRPCDKNLDADGDGLNQCEEMTLLTDEKKPDSDQDGIPDFFEARGMGLNPKFNESSKTSAGDGMTDHQHFMASLHTQIPFDNVADQNRVQFRLKNIGQDPYMTSTGQVIYMMNYKLDIINLPLVRTLAVTGINNQTYVQAASGDGTQAVMLTNPKDQVGAQNHGAGLNQYVFLIKMGALEKPDVNYWLIQRKELAYKLGGEKDTFNLNFELFHQLLLMKDVK